MSLDIVLKGGNVVLPNNKIEELDIGISDSKINAIGDLSRSSSKEIINMIQKNIFKPEFNIFIFIVALKAVVFLLQGEWIDLLYYYFYLKVYQFH